MGENKPSSELLLHVLTLSDACLNVFDNCLRHLVEIRYMILPFHLGFEETTQIILHLIDNSIVSLHCSSEFMRVGQMELFMFHM